MNGNAHLELLDWRRRIAALHAEVRAVASADPPAAHAHWCAARETLYRSHPQSPIPIESRAGFRARHHAYDPRLRFALPVDWEDADPAAGAAARAEIPSSGAVPFSFARIGSVAIPFPAGTRRLALFWLPDYAGGLFLSFRDRTNGQSTYGGGRYLLDTAKGADLGADPASGAPVLDFNFAFQPSCAFDPRWVCPLVAAENRLDLAIEAGERLV